MEMLLSAELAKPYQEMDPGFYQRECSDFYCRWMGIAHSTLSEEEVANRVKTILSARKRFLRRLALISDCLAATLVVLHWVSKFLFHMGDFIMTKTRIVNGILSGMLALYAVFILS